MNKRKNFENLQVELQNFTKSPLYNYRLENDYKPVLGEGSLDAKIMFIGEAPGKNEAINGRPFIGAAGKNLDKFLESAGLLRKNVFITSLLHDRPPGNRDPKPEEIKAYSPFLSRLIEIINPKILATLGRHSMRWVFEKYHLEDSLATISKIHGKVFEAGDNKRVLIIPLYHPAAAIYQQKLKVEIEEDFKKLSEISK